MAEAKGEHETAWALFEVEGDGDGYVRIRLIGSTLFKTEASATAKAKACYAVHLTRNEENAAYSALKVKFEPSVPGMSPDTCFTHVGKRTDVNVDALYHLGGWIVEELHISP